MSTPELLIKFEILGEPASKANSRKLVKFGNRPAFIKSDKARAYETAFAAQCPERNPLISGDIAVVIDIWYASRRPDLDESIILDMMQKRIYENDRQVKIKLVRHHLDKDRPRAEISIIRMVPDYTFQMLAQKA